MEDSGPETSLASLYEGSRKLRESGAQAKYILPAVHALLVLALWASSSLCDRGVAVIITGPSITFLSAILGIVDLPFSIVAFAVMFGGGRAETVAAIAWAVGCTLWWHLIGRAIDSLIRRNRASKTL